MTDLELDTADQIEQEEDVTGPPTEDTRAAWAEAARPILIKAAQRYRALVSYKDLAAQMQEATGIATRQPMQHWMADVLHRVLPGLDLADLNLTMAPRRARWLSPLGWRRLGVAVGEEHRDRGPAELGEHPGEVGGAVEAGVDEHALPHRGVVAGSGSGARLGGHGIAVDVEQLGPNGGDLHARQSSAGPRRARCVDMLGCVLPIVE